MRKLGAASRRPRPLRHLLAHAPPPGAASAESRPKCRVRTTAHAVPHRCGSPRSPTACDIPWDVRPIGEGRLLFTQRERASLTLIAGGRRHPWRQLPEQRVWVSGETGLMGLAIDPGFAENRRIYTCQGWKLPGGKKDIRVIALDAQRRSDARSADPTSCVKGLPTVIGRHGGCRLLIARTARCSSAPATRRDQEPAEPAARSAARPCASTRRPASRGRPTRGPTRTAGSASSTPTATATSRASPSVRTAPCGRSSTAPTATTRSTGSAAAATSAGGPGPVTTSPRR